MLEFVSALAAAVAATVDGATAPAAASQTSYVIGLVMYATHLVGGILWIGGLLGTGAMLVAAGRESDGELRKRLGTLARKTAMWADLGATIALLLGLHWLFKMKLYTAPHMHLKLALVVVLIGLHGFIRARAKKTALGSAAGIPPAILPVLALLALGIVFAVLVMARLP
jgi:uncharacterized membrane protein